MQRFNFDRKGFAQGIGVYANSISEAFEKAEIYQQKLVQDGEFNKNAKLTFRDNFDPRVSR